MLPESYIKQVQTKIVRLLRFGPHAHQPLRVLTQNNSYEVAKLLGYWIIEKFSTAKAYLAKGRLPGHIFHTVLVVEEDGEFWVLDSSIWKFFQNKRSMLVGKADSLEKAMLMITRAYTGKWQVGEKLTRSHIKAHELELIHLIKEMSK